MTRYIDAEKLIAERKRLHKAHSGKYGCDEVGLNLEYLEEFIISLQQEQPKVDLEKEIRAEWDVIDTELLQFEEFKAICFHFYELGLNARKEE